MNIFTVDSSGDYFLDFDFLCFYVKHFAFV